MEYTGTAVEAQQNNDIDGDLYHVSEIHSFPSTEETILTERGSCPHCDEEAYAPQSTRGLALIGALLVCGLVFLHLGYGSIGLVTLTSALLWMPVLGDLTKQVHNALSRVGL